MMCHAPHKFFDRTLLVASGLFLFALAVRATILCFEPQISRDGMYYYFQAIGADLEDFPEYGAQAPLFPGILKAFHHCGISPLYGGFALNLIVGSLIPVLLARIVRELSPSEFWCWGAGMLAAVHPNLVDASIKLERETLYVFFTALMLLALVRGYVPGRLLDFGLAGIAGAAAAATRFEGWEALPMISLLVLIRPLVIGAEKETRRTSLLGAACFVCGWFLSSALLLAVLRFPAARYVSLLWSYIAKLQRFFRG